MDEITLIPAGMRIPSHSRKNIQKPYKQDSNNYLRHNRTKKPAYAGGYTAEEEPWEQPSFSRAPSNEYNIGEVSMPMLTAPEIICKNREHIKLSNFPFRFNENTMFAPASKNEGLTEPGDLKKIVKSCSCTNCDGYLICQLWLSENIKFNEDYYGKPFFKRTPKEQSVPITKKFDQDRGFIIHGLIIPSPIVSVQETHFDETIQANLKSMNFTSPKGVQCYLWPAIQRGLSVFMVDAPQSGKTFAYLPAVCTFALEKSTLTQVEENGPSIIILLPNIEKCEKMKLTIHNLNKGSGIKTKIIALTDKCSSMSCDILLAVPSMLESFLKNHKFSLKHLCHLILDDVDLILKENSNSLSKLFHMFNYLQVKRPHHKNIQLIVASDKWTADLTTILRNLQSTPLIVFGDFLEAAIYSNIQFQRKNINTKYEKFYLRDLLKQQYSTHRSMVFCDESEIANLCEYLELNGVECIKISDELTEDERMQNAEMWLSLKLGCYKVLLCSDCTFDDSLKLTNADWICHFSFPQNWTNFKNRFKCMANNLSSPVQNQNGESNCFLIINEDRNEEIIKKIYSLISRSCMNQFCLI